MVTTIIDRHEETRMLFGKQDPDGNLSKTSKNSLIIEGDVQGTSLEGMLESYDKPKKLVHFYFSPSAVQVETLGEEIKCYIRKHLKTLKTVTLDFHGALGPQNEKMVPLLEWDENELDGLEYFVIFDPENKITKYNKEYVIDFLAKTKLKHFGLSSVDCEKTLFKILSQFMNLTYTNKTTPWKLYFDYTEGKTTTDTQRPAKILASLPKYHPNQTYLPKKPSEYEYALLSSSTLIEAVAEFFKKKRTTSLLFKYCFWIACRGWRVCDVFKKYGYRCITYINKYTQQVVICTNYEAFSESPKRREAALYMVDTCLKDYDSSINRLNIPIGPRCKLGDYSTIDARQTPTTMFNLSFASKSEHSIDQICVAAACEIGYYTSSVTFCSNGSKKYVKSILDCDLSNLDCITFLTAPTPYYNMSKAHLGEIRCFLAADGSNDLQRMFTRNITLNVDIMKPGLRCSTLQTRIFAANHPETWLKEDDIELFSRRKGYYTYLVDKKLQTMGIWLSKRNQPEREEYQKISNLVTSISEKSDFHLELPDFYSFLLVRLIPPAQTLVRLFIQLKKASAALEYFPSELHKIERLEGDRVYIQEFSKISTFINTLNYVAMTPKYQAIIRDYQDKIFFGQQIIDEQFIPFKRFLFSDFLVSDKSMAAHLSGFPSNFNLLLDTGISSNTVVDMKMEDILGRLDATCTEELQKEITADFGTLLHSIVCSIIEQENIPCEFAIMALGSWGKECPLPFLKHKLLIVTEKPSSECSDFFSNFCKKLHFKCKENGILLESPLKNIKQESDCDEDDWQDVILFGERNELFRSYISGQYPPKSLSIPPKNEKETHDSLIRLCTLWDSNIVFGKNSLAMTLASDFKNIVMGMMHSVDPKDRRKRSRQFMQSFFQLIQAKKEAEKKQLETSNDSVNRINIRHVHITLSNIISFLSLFNRVSSTNLWERIRTIVKEGMISKILGDQLLCGWNVVHSIYARGQKKYKTDEFFDDQSGTIANQHEVDVLKYVHKKLIPMMADKMGKFAIWLESFKARDTSPFFMDIESEPVVGQYYSLLVEKKLHGSSFAWSEVASLCEKASLQTKEKPLSFAVDIQELSLDAIRSFAQQEILAISLLNIEGINLEEMITIIPEDKVDECKDILSLWRRKYEIDLDTSGFVIWEKYRALQIYHACYYTLLGAILRDCESQILSADAIWSGCLDNDSFKNLVFECLNECYPAWEILFTLESRPPIVERLSYLPVNSLGLRLQEEQKEQYFEELLRTNSTPNPTNESDIKFTFKKMSRYFCGSISSTITESMKHIESKSTTITLSDCEFELTPSTCSQHLALHSLKKRISGTAVSYYPLTLYVIQKPCSVMLSKKPEQIGLQHAHMDILSDSRCYSLCYTLKIFESLILQSKHDLKQVIGPTGVNPWSNYDALCYYGMERFDDAPFLSPLFLLDKVLSLCDPDAVKIFLSLSPYLILSQWDAKATSGYTIEIFQRFSRLQNILRRKECSTLSHMDLLCIMEPQLVSLYQKAIFPLEKSLEKRWNILISGHVTLKSSSFSQTIRDNNVEIVWTLERKKNEIRDHMASVEKLPLAKSIKLLLLRKGEYVEGGKKIFDAVISCYRKCSFISTNAVETIATCLEELDHLQELNLTYLPSIAMNDVSKYLKKYKTSLRFLDLSGVYSLREKKSATLMKNIAACSILQNLQLNKLDWKHIDLSSYSFPNLHVLSAVACPFLTDFKFTLYNMARVRSISLHDNPALSKIDILGNSKKLPKNCTVAMNLQRTIIPIDKLLRIKKILSAQLRDSETHLCRPKLNVSVLYVNDAAMKPQKKEWAIGKFVNTLEEKTSFLLFTETTSKPNMEALWHILPGFLDIILGYPIHFLKVLQTFNAAYSKNMGKILQQRGELLFKLVLQGTKEVRENVRVDTIPSDGMWYVNELLKAGYVKAYLKYGAERGWPITQFKECSILSTEWKSAIDRYMEREKEIQKNQISFLRPYQFAKILFDEKLRGENIQNPKHNFIEIVNPTVHEGNWELFAQRHELPRKGEKVAYFAFVNESGFLFTPEFVMGLKEFLFSHLDTLKTIVLRFCGALRASPDPSKDFLNGWEAKFQMKDQIDYFLISDPFFKITKAKKEDLADFLMISTRHIKHFGVQGIHSEKTLHKILTCAIGKGIGEEKKIHFEYNGELRTNTPQNILSSFPLNSSHHIYPTKRPTELEYVLMSQLAYKGATLEEVSALMMNPKEKISIPQAAKETIKKEEGENDPKLKPNYFWLTTRGWNCVEVCRYIKSGKHCILDNVKEYTQTAHYSGAVFANKYTRQIVLASRGTQGDQFGSGLADIFQVFARIDTHGLKGHLFATHLKTAEDLLHKVLDGTITKGIKIFPKCRAGHYDTLIGTSYEEREENRFNLSFTGHSLGGWLSEVLMAKACTLTYRTSAVTFDSPGSYKMVRKLVTAKDATFDCTNFVSSPNPINAFNRQTGEVRCILKTTPLCHQILAGMKKIRNGDLVDVLTSFVIHITKFHDIKNFIAAGSTSHKQLAAATSSNWSRLSSELTTSTKFSQQIKNLTNPFRYIFTVARFCLHYREFLQHSAIQNHFSGLLSCRKNELSITGMEPVQDGKDLLVRAMKKQSRGGLSLLFPDEYSFMLSRLYPPFQSLVKAVTVGKTSRGKFPEEIRYFLNMVTSLEGTRVTINNILTPRKFISQCNQLASTQRVVELAISSSEFKSSENTRVIIDNEFTSFKRQLKSILFPDKLNIEEDGFTYDIVHFNDFTTINSEGHTKMEDILGRLDATCTEELQKEIMADFGTLLHSIVCSIIEQENIPCEFAIMALGSWGKECPLPFLKHKLLIVTEKPSSECSDFFWNFCKKLHFKCKESGILLESPLKNIKQESDCDEDDWQDVILFGERNELFRSYISGQYPLPKDPKSSNTSRETHGYLIRLCSVWDSNFIYGKSSTSTILASDFKNMVVGMMHSIDPCSYRERSRQFIQSFFRLINEKKEEEKMKRGLEEASNSMSSEEIKEHQIDVRHIHIQLSNIISFLSLYNRVSSTNPWERIRTIVEGGMISEILGDQLLCGWNVVHSIYARGQKKYKKDEFVVQYESQRNKTTVRVRSADPILSHDELEVLVFVKEKLLERMADKMGEFAEWLEYTYPQTSSPFSHGKPNDQVKAYYYHEAAKLVRNSKTNDFFTWKAVASLCLKAKGQTKHKHKVSKKKGSWHIRMGLEEEYKNINPVKAAEQEEHTQTLLHQIVSALPKPGKEGHGIRFYNTIHNLLVNDWIHQRDDNEIIQFLGEDSAQEDGTQDGACKEAERILGEWKTNHKETYGVLNRVAEEIYDYCYFVVFAVIYTKADTSVLLSACLQSSVCHEIIHHCLDFCFPHWEQTQLFAVQKEVENQMQNVFCQVPNERGTRHLKIIKFMKQCNQISINDTPSSTTLGLIIEGKENNIKLGKHFANALCDKIYSGAVSFTLPSPLDMYNCVFHERFDKLPITSHIRMIKNLISGHSFSLLFFKEQSMPLLLHIECNEDKLNEITAKNLEFLESLVLPFDEEYLVPEGNALCDYNAVKIFISLSPKAVLDSWLLYVKRCTDSSLPSTSIVSGIYQRFTHLQNILAPLISDLEMKVQLSIDDLRDLSLQTDLDQELEVEENENDVQKVLNDLESLHCRLKRVTEKMGKNYSKFAAPLVKKINESISSNLTEPQLHIRNMIEECATQASRPYEREKIFLASLNSFGANRLQSLSLGSLPFLEKEYIMDFILPSFKVSLRFLDLSGNHTLDATHVLKAIYGFSCLRILRLNDLPWRGQFEFRKGFSLPALSSLSLENCIHLERIRVRLPCVPRLKHLSLNGCSSLDYFSLGDLNSWVKNSSSFFVIEMLDCPDVAVLGQIQKERKMSKILISYFEDKEAMIMEKKRIYIRVRSLNTIEKLEGSTLEELRKLAADKKHCELQPDSDADVFNEMIFNVVLDDLLRKKTTTGEAGAVYMDILKECYANFKPSKKNIRKVYPIIEIMEKTTINQQKAKELTAFLNKNC